MPKRRPQPLIPVNKEENKSHSRISSDILRLLDETERKEWHLDVNKSKFFRETLIKVLTKRLECDIISIRSEDLTKNPNYAITIADKLGYQRALDECIKLLQE